MARLYREAPLNSVWEGTANMMCMDVRRAMAKEPRTIQALFDETHPLLGQDGRFDALVLHTETLVREAVEDEFVARPMTEAVARLLQGAELLRHSTAEISSSEPACRTEQGLGARTTGPWVRRLSSEGAQGHAPCRGGWLRRSDGCGQVDLVRGILPATNDLISRLQHELSADTLKRAVKVCS